MSYRQELWEVAASHNGVVTVSDEDLTSYDGVPATTVQRALEDMRDRMPRDRWEAVVDEALRRDVIGEQDSTALKPVSA